MKKATVILAIVLATCTGALAGDVAWGPRLGYTDSGSISQFHFGGHVEVYHLSTNVTFLPSVELGVGDGTLLAFNGDLVYEFTELASAPWSFYGGGGPMLSYYDNDGNNQTDFALSLVAGTTYDLDSGQELLGEIRLGLEDAPDIKLTVGISFN